MKLMLRYSVLFLFGQILTSANCFAQIMQIGLEIDFKGQVNLISWEGDTHPEYYGIEVDFEETFGKDKSLYSISQYEFVESYLRLIQPTDISTSFYSTINEFNYNNVFGNTTIDSFFFTNHTISAYQANIYIIDSTAQLEKVEEINATILPPKFEDLWDYEGEISDETKLKIKQDLLTYIDTNYNSISAMDLRQNLQDYMLQGDTIIDDSLIFDHKIKTLTFFVYANDKLTDVISYNENHTVIEYDKIIYNPKGQVMYYYRKTIGDLTGGISVSIEYDTMNRACMSTYINYGCEKEGYSAITIVNYQYYQYDKDGLLYKIIRPTETETAITTITALKVKE